MKGNVVKVIIILSIIIVAPLLADGDMVYSDSYVSSTDLTYDSTTTGSIQESNANISITNSSQDESAKQTSNEFYDDVNDVINDVRPNAIQMQDLTSILPGSHTPDGNGVYFILPLKSGIVHQPPLEQYIRAGDQGYADLAIRTTSIETFNSIKANVQGWKYNETNQTWDKTERYTGFKSNGDVLGMSLKLNFSIAIKNLSEGTYYFQVDTSLKRSLLPFDRKDYYSQFAKVVVLPENVATTNMTITSPNVILGGVDYPIHVDVEPHDSTSPITWSSEFHNAGYTDKLVYFPEKGQESEFQLDTSKISSTLENSINTSTINPGFALDVITEANNVETPFLQERKQIFYGGLPAKISAVDNDIMWHLDKEALNDLNKVSEEVDSWSYEWEYFEHGSNTVKSFNRIKDVSYKAEKIQNITELGTNENYFLKIPYSSSFHEIAYQATQNGKPLSVRLKITAKSRNGLWGALFPTTQTVYSNRAELQILDNKVTLTNVPDFNFGEIPISYIYEGSNGKELKSLNNDLLEITDTRIDKQTDWMLSAKLSPFINNNDNNVQLNPLNSLNLKSSDNTDSLNVTIQNELLEVIKSNSSKHLTVNANLALLPSPNAIVNKEDTFTSQITWTLTTSQIKTHSLK